MFNQLGEMAPPPSTAGYTYTFMERNPYLLSAAEQQQHAAGAAQQQDYFSVGQQALRGGRLEDAVAAFEAEVQVRSDGGET